MLSQSNGLTAQTIAKVTVVNLYDTLAVREMSRRICPAHLVWGHSLLRRLFAAILS
jgi:hypothetical protein